MDFEGASLRSKINFSFALVLIRDIRFLVLFCTSASFTSWKLCLRYRARFLTRTKSEESWTNE